MILFRMFYFYLNAHWTTYFDDAKVMYYYCNPMIFHETNQYLANPCCVQSLYPSKLIEKSCCNLRGWQEC